MKNLLKTGISKVGSLIGNVAGGLFSNIRLVLIGAAVLAVASIALYVWHLRADLATAHAQVQSAKQALSQATAVNQSNLLENQKLRKQLQLERAAFASESSTLAQNANEAGKLKAQVNAEPKGQGGPLSPSWNALFSQMAKAQGK